MITEIDEATAFAGAMAIADSFGLGDSCKPSRSWPVDDGDRVLCAEYSGDASGTILLAVNLDVAERLEADPQRLAGGFSAALDAIGESTSAQLELGEVAVSDIAAVRIVEIWDEERRCALFGITPRSEQEAAVEPDADVDQSADATMGAITAASAANGGRVAGGLGAERSSGLLDDVDVSVSVELGRTMMSVRDLLAIMPGTVIQLDRLVSEPVDVLVNSRHFAAGHVVTIDDNFGVRIAEDGAVSHS